MVRLIGAVLILFGTVGIGYDRMRQIKRHYEGLLDWRECMLKIQGDMQSLKKPLPDIIAELGHHAPWLFYQSDAGGQEGEREQCGCWLITKKKKLKGR